MARGVKLKFKREAFDQLLGDLALPAVQAKGEAIAAACNSGSSWGGYFTSASASGKRARATVWSADNRNDEARDQRLLRNLDAE